MSDHRPDAHAPPNPAKVSAWGSPWLRSAWCCAPRASPFGSWWALRSWWVGGSAGSVSDCWRTRLALVALRWRAPSASTACSTEGVGNFRPHFTGWPLLRRRCAPTDCPGAVCRWVVVIWEFVRFNILQGGSAMYGSHPWHWNFTQVQHRASPAQGFPSGLAYPYLGPPYPIHSSFTRTLCRSTEWRPVLLFM